MRTRECCFLGWTDSHSAVARPERLQERLKGKKKKTQKTGTGTVRSVVSPEDRGKEGHRGTLRQVGVHTHKACCAQSARLVQYAGRRAHRELGASTHSGRH